MMDAIEKKSLRRALAKLVKRKELNDKSITLFGASADSRAVFETLKAFGLSASFVVDNDVKKQGKSYLGLKVSPPLETLLSHAGKNAVLIYSGAYSDSMLNEVVSYGYVLGSDVFCLSARRKDGLGEFLRSAAAVVKGYKSYKRLTRGRAPNCAVFLMPYSGIGDTYLAGLFFHEYLAANSVKDYVFAVSNEGCRQVAEMFEIQNIVTLPQREQDGIISARRFGRSHWPVKILNDAWVADYTNVNGRLRGYRGLNFEKVFRQFVFELGCEIKLRHPVSEINDAFNKELFVSGGLIQGRTVILAPYSNTLLALPNELWSGIAAECARMGFMVCTNCAGEAEKPIAGTVPIRVPLRYMPGVLEFAGCFIGARSGLCDVISSAKCTKIILYDKDYVFHFASSYEYFSLNGMGLCSDAAEYEVDSNNYDAAIAAIADLLADKARG